MKTTTDIHNLSKLWGIIHSMHLYSTKAEAIFKTVIITTSLIGSIGIDFSTTQTQINKDVGTAFYLFSIALIMEFIIPLIKSNKFLPKIYPFCLFIANIFIYLVALAVLLERPLGVNSNCVIFFIVLSIALIWLDTLLMLMIEPPSPQIVAVENTLKGTKN